MNIIDRFDRVMDAYPNNLRNLIWTTCCVALHLSYTPAICLLQSLNYIVIHHYPNAAKCIFKYSKSMHVLPQNVSELDQILPLSKSLLLLCFHLHVFQCHLLLLLRFFCSDWLLLSTFFADNSTPISIRRHHIFNL
jgi:hypothetical protein